MFLLFLSAVGCTNLIPPEDAWIKREDDKITIGCYTSRQTWQLRCHDGRWTGVVSNCSHSHGLQGRIQTVFHHDPENGQNLSQNINNFCGTCIFKDVCECDENEK